MLAQIIEGELDWAELFFIVAVVLFVLDVIIRVARPALATPAAILTVAGLACLAFGFVCW